MIPLKYRPAALERPRSAGRGFELAVFIWGVVTGLISYWIIAPRLYLILRYGWARVRQEGLTVVEMHHLHERWTISNGDEFFVWEHQHDLLGLAVWVPIMVVTVPILWLVFRMAKGKGAGWRPTVARPR